ncbi:MAG: hypothetical protein KDK75_11125 [Alphaproteobacteria bacterium]|nr:hypothetical protein [Alphaproteobacteria bacterium]
MIFALQLADLMERSRRLQAYRQARAQAEALTDADLADMGTKRAYLGTIARKLALK